jgi:hypothetical protein
MNDLSCAQVFNCVHERREKRTIVFHPVPLYMDDNDSKAQLFEVMLMLEAFIGGHQNVTFAVGLGDQLRVRECAPFGFGDGQDLVMGEGLPQAGIDALV